ncbi:MAG TPA: ROK family protein [Roseiflexaceae bacterium]|nr:ROK family protein [Roseiflexaceae bacterium]
MTTDNGRRTTDHAIGLDVGGTKIAGGVVALDTGQVLTRRMIPTRAERGGDAVLADARALAEALRADAGHLGAGVCGVGIGVPELVDLAGNITSGHTIAWRGLPVRERFGRFGPSVVESDVRAHALAEARYGAGRSFKQFVFVTVGTGISSCLVQDGIPYAGARGNALVLASSPLTTACTTCGAKLRPVLEEFASGPALVARYNHAGAGTAARGQDVLAAAEAGDTSAMHVVFTAGEALGVSVGWLINVLDPEAVIVGGGLGSAGGLYWKSFVAAARAHIWAEASRDLPILMAALGPDAGLIGAAIAAGDLERRSRIRE